MKNLLLLFLFLGFYFTPKCQTPTTFYLVRHAEKVTTNPSNKDPMLTGEGQKRAMALAKVLKKTKLNSIYSTDYQRTKLTVKPISEKQKVEINLYNPNQLKSSAKALLQEHKGGNVLIVGHSNTVLETIEALGGKRPISEITDQDYDYLFTLKIANDGNTTVKVEHYGEKSSGKEGAQMMKNK